MIPKGLFSQILLLLMAVGIVLLYVRPTFSQIAEKQDTITLYQNERGKVEQVNRDLQMRLSELESISSTDHRRLLTYMPDSVDELVVMRDIQNIVSRTGLILSNIAEDTGTQNSSRAARNRTNVETVQESDTGAYAYPFTITVEGSYNQIKLLLNALQLNDYPLEVHGITVSANAGGFLTADLRIVTYAHLPPEETSI